MKESGDTVNAADALVGAQRDLRANKNLAHPYFWAPYIVVGTIKKAKTELAAGKSPNGRY